MDNRCSGARAIPECLRQNLFKARPFQGQLGVSNTSAKMRGNFFPMSAAFTKRTLNIVFGNDDLKSNIQVLWNTPRQPESRCSGAGGKKIVARAR
jgi:hypothetical protein